MKKQILILFMALFALGATQVFAQNDGPYLEPNPVECIDLDDPLTPVAGRPYTYSVDVPTPDGAKIYHWFVTQDTEFILEGDIVATAENLDPDDGPVSSILASGSTHYNEETPDANTIELTWQSFTLDPGDFVFVVIWVENEAPDGCITDNLKVYRIMPQHAFALTVGNVEIDGTTGTIEADPLICVDDVQSAIFNPAADDGNGAVFYDYGQNAFYFAVAAANFSGDFQVAATFDGLQPAAAEVIDGVGQSAIIFVDTSLEDLINETDPTNGVVYNDALDYNIIGDFSPPAGSSYGEGQDEGDDDAAFMFYIKVVVEHNQFEAITAQTYTLALDAVLWDAVAEEFGDHDGDNLLGDIDNTDTTDGCERDPFGLHNQMAQTLMPRPDVQPVDPDAFVDPTGVEP